MNKSRFAFLFRVIVLPWAIAAVPAVAKADAVEDFFHAVVMNNASEVRLHLQQGMNPNATEKNRGNTAMVVALLEGSMQAFDVLVNAPNIDLEARSKNGNNALMIAAFKGNRKAFNVLLDKGAAISRPDWCVLHYAAAAGNDKLVELLLDRGADINARAPNRTTPLMIAAYEGFDLTVKLLLARGADVALTNVSGQNAADYAKRLGRQDIIALLNEHLENALKQHAHSQPIGDDGPDSLQALVRLPQ